MGDEIKFRASIHLIHIFKTRQSRTFRLVINKEVYRGNYLFLIRDLSSRLRLNKALGSLCADGALQIQLKPLNIETNFPVASRTMNYLVKVNII